MSPSRPVRGNIGKWDGQRAGRQASSVDRERERGPLNDAQGNGRIMPATAFALACVVASIFFAGHAFGRTTTLMEARTTLIPAAVAAALLQRPLAGEWVPIGPDMACRRDKGALSVRLFGNEQFVLTDDVGRRELPPPPPWWPPAPAPAVADNDFTSNPVRD